MLHYLSAVKALPYTNDSRARHIVTSGAMVSAFHAVACVTPRTGGVSPLASVLSHYAIDVGGFGGQSIAEATESLPIIQASVIGRRHEVTMYFDGVKSCAGSGTTGSEPKYLFRFPSAFKLESGSDMMTFINDILDAAGMTGDRSPMTLAKWFVSEWETMPEVVQLR